MTFRESTEENRTIEHVPYARSQLAGSELNGSALKLKWDIGARKIIGHPANIIHTEYGSRGFSPGSPEGGLAQIGVDEGFDVDASDWEGLRMNAEPWGSGDSLDTRFRAAHQAALNRIVGVAFGCQFELFSARTMLLMSFWLSCLSGDGELGVHPCGVVSGEVADQLIPAWLQRDAHPA